MTATHLTDLAVSGAITATSVAATSLSGTLTGDVIDGLQIASGANGAISIKSGSVLLTKADGASAFTLADPAAADAGKQLCITSETAQAHTVTIAGGLNGGGAAADVGTFGGAIGDYVCLVAYNSKWYLLHKLNVTFA